MTRDFEHDLRRLALRRYADTELAAVEDRLLLEDGFAERLREAEYDLLDDYAANCLDAGERADVERHLLVTAGDRDALRVAKALARRRAAAPARPDTANQTTAGPRPLKDTESAPWRWSARPWWSVAAAATVAGTFLLAGLLPRWRDHRVVGSPVLSQAGPPSAAVDGKDDGVAARSSTATVLLLAEVERGTTGRPLRLAEQLQGVRLQTELPGPSVAASYELVVTTGSTGVPFIARGLAPRTSGAYQYLEASVPRAVLSSGRHEITIRPEPVVDGAAPAFTWRVDITSGR